MMKTRLPTPERGLGAYLAPASSSPVLVIDDDPVSERTTLTWLREVGYTAVAEPDGAAALRLVRTSVMQLVVSELYIPTVEGACVVVAIKQERSRLPRLRVLVHTRHYTAADVAWTIAVGADGSVRKGSAADALIREVRRLVGNDATEPPHTRPDARNRSRP